MNGYRYTYYDPRTAGCLRQAGCLMLLGIVLLMCLMPLVLVDLMRQALERLHLSPPVALLAVLGIFVGGLFNIPLWRVPRQEQQIVDRFAVYGFSGFGPQFQVFRPDTVVALNVGGGLIPILLAVYELGQVVNAGGWPLQALLIVLVVNIAVCYAVTRPAPGIGLLMPAFASPAVCVGLTWLLLWQGVYEPTRAPVAFVAGVLGPVIGADLLHLKDIYRVSAGVVSIGGAGTFDGIVLSGFLAALLA